MKIRVLLLTFLIYSCSNNKISNKNIPVVDTSIVSIADTLKNECNFSEVLRSITHVDTIADKLNYKEDTIKSFDSKRRLIELCVTNPYESNSAKLYFLRFVYDTVGNLIYKSRSLNFIQEEWYCYKYDKMGKLLTKQGQDSIGNQISEKYVY